MTQRRLRSFFGLVVFCSVSAAVAQPETYLIDSDHSYILYHVNHFDFSESSGKWIFNGSLELDTSKPQNSKITINIPIADLDTGVAVLNDHLRGKLFFDAVHYPTATFTSTKVILTGKDIAKVIGILTLHGVSHTVALDVKLNKLGINFATEKQTAGFTATTQIKRSDYNILTLLPEVGDDVKIEIQAEAALDIKTSSHSSS